MGRYEIVAGSGGDWDLFDDDGVLVAWWDRDRECTYIVYSERSQFAHLNRKPATEAYGLLVFNAIKQQLKSGEQP